jgi:hypothetical protein
VNVTSLRRTRKLSSSKNQVWTPPEASVTFNR